MPELPEVEVARRSIEPELIDQTISDVICRTPRLRWPLDPDLPKKLIGRRVIAVHRRGKYLLLAFDQPHLTTKKPGAVGGWLLVHLGMSGSLSIAPCEKPPQRHDHFDLIFGHKLLRLHDPRRFGAVLWHDGPEISAQPLLARLGPEPFEPELDGNWLYRALSERRGPIKPALMDSHLIVGIGNIYASESLFRAGISPLRSAQRISAKHCSRLIESVCATLSEAITAGGSSLRDYVHTDGGAGCFQLQYAVYEREGQPCRCCHSPIRSIRQAGRSTYYCPRCQR